MEGAGGTGVRNNAGSDGRTALCLAAPANEHLQAAVLFDLRRTCRLLCYSHLTPTPLSLRPPLPPGLHSADNIHEFSNAMNMGLTLRDLKFNVHAHPTVAEVGSGGGLLVGAVRPGRSVSRAGCHQWAWQV